MEEIDILGPSIGLEVISTSISQHAGVGRKAQGARFIINNFLIFLILEP